MSTAETPTINPHDTPPEVARHATQQARLDRLALIGIFGSETAPGALIRLADGTFQRVVPGDAVAGQTVAAIGEDSVMLARGTRTRALRLPET